MRLIDAHTHAWGCDTAELPWRADVLPPEWTGPYAHGDLIADMDRVGVDESVVVSTPLYGRGVRANEYTMRAIEAHPDRLYGVGVLDFFGPEPDVRERLRRVTGQPRMLGVRFHAALTYDEIPTELDRSGEWIADERLDPVWDELAALDATAFVFPKAQQLATLESVIADHPDVRFVVDHMACRTGPPRRTSRRGRGSRASPATTTRASRSVRSPARPTRAGPTPTVTATWKTSSSGSVRTG